MKIVSNQTSIQRNKRIGNIAIIASLVIVGAGLYLYFRQIAIGWSFIAFVAGFLISQIGLYFSSRFGRSPRPDEMLSAALKGLDNKYTLYHYTSPVPHLLVGPAGIWILSPYNQRGLITYDEKKKRFHQKGGNLYFKIFGQEGLGRPDLDVRNNLQSMAKFMRKKFPDLTDRSFDNIIVFTNENVEIQAENSPYPTLPAKKLKDYLRRQAKENPADLDLITRVERELPDEDI